MVKRAGITLPAFFVPSPLDSRTESSYISPMSAMKSRYARQAKQQRDVVADGGIPIAQLIGPLLRSVKLDEQARMGVLEEKWAAAVGKAIATHTRPGVLKEKELTVFVDSSPWLSELHRMQRDVLSKLQATFGRDKILKIRLQLDPGKP